MSSCYIIDDEAFSINALTGYISKAPELQLAGSNTNPFEALEAIALQQPDIVFLDVNMPTISGIEVAKQLPHCTAIIFTTAHAKYALDAFQIDAMDFLLKPFSFDMFTKSVKKVSERMKKSIPLAPIKEIDSLFINPGTKGKVIQVSIEEISHIEALDHSVIIYTLNEKHITKIRLKELDEKLPATKFIKVHRSFVVNIKLIKSIAGSQITLANGKIVPLGDSFRNLLLAKIQHRTV